MRDLMCAGIILVVAAAATSPCLGATQHDGAASPARTSGIALAQSAPKATSPAAVARAVEVVISGKVQRVGFRKWVVRRAKALGVRGWVENAPDGTVHALFGGTEDAVAALLAECHRGPRGSIVRNVVATPADPAGVPTGFRQRDAFAARAASSLALPLSDRQNIRRRSLETLPPIG